MNSFLLIFVYTVLLGSYDDVKLWKALWTRLYYVKFIVPIFNTGWWVNLLDHYHKRETSISAHFYVALKSLQYTFPFHYSLGVFPFNWIEPIEVRNCLKFYFWILPFSASQTFLPIYSLVHTIFSFLIIINHKGHRNILAPASTDI